MKYISLIFIICLSIYSCSNHKGSKEDIEKKDEIVIDKFTPIPFEIEKSPSIDLPDSLGGKEMTGKIVVTVDLDSLGKIVNYEITTFVTPNVEYFGKKDNYPIEINRYNNWIKEYLSQIVFKKNNAAKIKLINRILVPISLNAQ